MPQKAVRAAGTTNRSASECSPADRRRASGRNKQQNSAAAHFIFRSPSIPARSAARSPSPGTYRCSGIPITTPTPISTPRTREWPGQQAADQRKREDTIEEPGMVIRKPPPDRLRHQRIDAGEPGPDEADADGSAERVVGERQDQAAEDARLSMLLISRRPWRTRWQNGHGDQAPGEQEQPVQAPES